MPPPYADEYDYNYDLASNRVGEQINTQVRQSTYNNVNQITGIAAGDPSKFIVSFHRNEEGQMTFDKHVSIRITYNDDSDSGYIFLSNIVAGSISESIQVAHFGDGPIILDFDTNEKLVGIEISQFSKLMSSKLIERIRDPQPEE